MVPHPVATNGRLELIPLAESPVAGVVLRIIGSIRSVETIAVGAEIRDLGRLRKQYGGKRWRKCKGIAIVDLPERGLVAAEVHWYEAHGIGRRRMKVKRVLD